MTRRPLVPALLTGTLVVIALNLLVAAWSHRFPYHQRLEYIRTSPNPNLLFIGNSLLDGRVDEPAFVRAAMGAGSRPLNAAVESSPPPQHQLLFQYAVRLHPSIRTVVLGIFDFQLTAPDTSHAGDLIGNRMMAVDSRFPFDEVVSTYRFDLLDQAELEALRLLPMFANRSSAWREVELLRRGMGSMGMPAATTNNMGRVDDFALLEAENLSAFDAQARDFLLRPDHFNPNYESVFKEADRAGIKIVIVVMPMSPWHRREFYERPVWRQYMAAVADLACKRGIGVIDASSWIPDARSFLDHIHMTQQAAHDFSVRLGGELAQPH